jgi:outer membrane protein assembly factor BamB
MLGRCPTRIGRTSVVGPANPVNRWSTIGGNTGFTTTPVIDRDGNLYVGRQFAGLASYGRDGGFRWSFTRSSFTGYSPAITADDAIVFAMSDGTVFALETDGGVRWQARPGTTAIVSAPLVVPDGTIWVGDQNARMHALASDGGLRWTHDQNLYCNAMPGGPALHPAGFVWFGCASYGFRAPLDGPDAGFVTGGLFCGTNSLIRSPLTIGPNASVWVGCGFGNLIWWDTAQRSVPYASSGVEHFYGSPVVASDDRVFFSVTDTIYWRTLDGGSGALKTLPSAIAGHLIIDGEDNVYAVAGPGLYSVRPDGGLRWQRALPDSMYALASPSIGADGTLYVGTVPSNSLTSWLMAFGD